MLKALLLRRAIFFSGELGAQRRHGRAGGRRLASMARGGGTGERRRARPQRAGAVARRAQRAEPRRRMRAAVAVPTLSSGGGRSGATCGTGGRWGRKRQRRWGARAAWDGGGGREGARK
ncbi:hypothetical protein PVAP13_8KG204602 [Panicum virgatum]|uniref:Uncharacterized protein n=1 Tax=Panicum virgatum TaxID=38727 RepID=A0A8T0PLI8_PANVG|nr:hypothetical protein PVAP13_8KG204602 [Panicum virgatum]